MSLKHKDINFKPAKKSNHNIANKPKCSHYKVVNINQIVSVQAICLRVDSCAPRDLAGVKVSLTFLRFDLGHVKAKGKDLC